MPNEKGDLVEPKGLCGVIKTYHLPSPVVGLEVDGFRACLGKVLREEVLRGEVPRGEANVVEDKVEEFHREARPLLPE